MITRDQFSSLYESTQVQEILEYAEWLATYRECSIQSAVLEILRAGKSRVEQLRKYREKRQDSAATFRPYAPLKASDTTRVETKRRAAAEGVSSEVTTICGFEDLRGRRCWLRPHAEHVDHKF